MSSIGDGRLPPRPWSRGAAFPEDAMTELTRRRIVAAAATAAAGALAPLAPPAQAAAPLAGRQAPSFYRCKVGEFEVTVVNDGARAIPLPAQFVRNVGNEQVLAAAEAAYMPKGSIIAPFNPVVVNTGANIVLISHLHGDHILGLKTPDGALAFPNAEIKVPAIDWAFWMNDGNMSRAPEGFTKTSFGFNRKIFSNLADKVTRYEWGREVAPGITAVETS